MKPEKAVARWRAFVSTAAAVAVFTAACSSPEPAGLATPQPTVPSTTQVRATPESARDELIASIEARDEVALRALWPASSWETIGVDVLADFEVAPDLGACERLSANRAHCFVFEQDLPFVLGLTMELDNAGRWGLSIASLDSTN